MAERTHWWTEVSSLSLSLSLFLSLSLSFSLFLSLSLSFSLFLWLSTYLPTDLSMYVSIYRSIDLSISLSLCLSLYLSNYLSIDLSIDPSIYLSISLSQSVYMSVYLSVYLQAWKRSYSARLPQFLKLTTSKTKQFCESSFKQWKVECRADGLVPQCVLRFFDSTCLSIAPATKKWYRVIRSAAPVTQNHLSKPEDLMLQNATPLRKAAPWPPTSLINMSLVLRLPRKMHLCRSSSHVPRLPSFLEMPQNPHVLLTSDRVHYPLRLPRKTTSERPKVVRACGMFTCWQRHVLRATTACTFSTSQLPKVVRTWCALYILTSKCTSRHNGVHFFDISTSKSGPNLVCFVHFDFEMCFAPQRCSLSRHLNFQKWSENGVFSTFWLRNVLRAKTACNFSSLIWPDGSAPAALASLLFDPPEPQIIGKTQCFATFLPLRAPGSSFFWDFLFFDLLSSSLLFSDSSHLCFSSVILSEVWLLNFVRWLKIVQISCKRSVYIYIVYIYINIYIYIYIYIYIFISIHITQVHIQYV